MRIPTAILWGRLLAGSLTLLLVLATPILAEESAVIGCWEWEISVGGIAGVTLTPAGEGYTVQLRFEADGTFYRYVDEVQQQSGTYTYSGDAVTGSLWTGPFGLGIDPISVVRGVDGVGVYLQLVDSCCDGFASTYRERGCAPLADRSRTWGALKSLYHDD
jgi:hypothetical protein